MAREQRQFLTREEARTILRFSRSKIDAETRSGRLRVHRFGRLLRIDARDLEDYIRQARQQECRYAERTGAGR